MLKTSRSTESSTRPAEGVVGVASNTRAGRERSKLERNELNGGEVDGSKVDGSEVDGSEVEVDEVGKKVQKMSKSKNSSKSKKMVGSSNFFTPTAKLAFTKLKQTFLKAPILQYIDPECHIRIETDVSSYAISKVFS